MNLSCHSYIAQVVRIFCVIDCNFSYIYLCFTVLLSVTLDIDKNCDFCFFLKDANKCHFLVVHFAYGLKYKHSCLKLPNDYDKSVNITEAR